MKVSEVGNGDRKVEGQESEGNFDDMMAGIVSLYQPRLVKIPATLSRLPVGQLLFPASVYR